MRLFNQNIQDDVGSCKSMTADEIRKMENKLYEFDIEKDIKAGMLIKLVLDRNEIEWGVVLPIKGGLAICGRSIFRKSNNIVPLFYLYTKKSWGLKLEDIDEVYDISESTECNIFNTNCRELLYKRSETNINEQWFRLMWRYKAKHPEYDDRSAIANFYRIHGIIDKPRNHCYACEECRVECSKCPLVRAGMRPCTHKESLWFIHNKLDYANDVEGRRIVRNIISELPWERSK